MFRWITENRIYKSLDRALTYLNDRNAGLISAGVAFYALFAIFPGLAALIAVFGLVSDPIAVNAQLELLAEFIPEAAYVLLKGQIDRLLTTSGEALGWATVLSIGLALWSARAGVAALMRGLNAISAKSNRHGLRHMMVAMLLTLGLIGITIVALLAVVVAPIVFQIFPALRDLGWPLETIRWSVALAAQVLGLGLLYRYGPNSRGNRQGLFTPGGALVIAAWFLVTAGFSTYVSNFARYNEVYGSIGAVIVLLMWFYLSAYLILLGAALNEVLAQRRTRSGRV